MSLPNSAPLPPCCWLPCRAWRWKNHLQLKHVHQFQFAGYYAAWSRATTRKPDWMCRFSRQTATRAGARRAGRQGRIRHRRSSLLLARLAGKPVVVLGVIFQHSPYALAMRQSGGDPDLRRLIGKRVMIGALTDELGNADELLAYLVKEGCRRTASSASSTASIRGPDQRQGRGHGDLHHQRAGHLRPPRLPYDIYSPRAVGIDFYGDNLFTSEQEIANHPARVAAFRAASMRGWQWAMSHQEETADLILNKYSRRADRQHLLYEARQMVPLVQPVLVEIGYMNPDRWHHIADVYAGLACCPRTPASTALCTVDSTRPSLVWLYRALGVAALLLVLGAAVHFSQLRASASGRWRSSARASSASAPCSKPRRWASR
jgi:hypothetical protein